MWIQEFSRDKQEQSRVLLILLGLLFKTSQKIVKIKLEWVPVILYGF